MWLVLCEGNPLVTGGFPSQRPVTRSFVVFFDLRLNKPVWANNRDAGDLRRHRAHYDVTVMESLQNRRLCDYDDQYGMVANQIWAKCGFKGHGVPICLLWRNDILMPVGQQMNDTKIQWNKWWIPATWHSGRYLEMIFNSLRPSDAYMRL